MYGRNKNYGDRGGFQRAPVNVGDEFEVKIESVAEKGDGVAKKDGFVLFIPNAKQGDAVKVRVTKVFRKFGFAEVVGEGSQAPAEEESAEEDYVEEEVQEEATKDSEDFGEEELEE